MYDLRWYQKEAVEATWGCLEKRPGNPVIVLPTGAGKSIVIAELCRHAWQEWGVPSLVLAHRKELLVQNAEKIQALLEGHVDVGLHSAGLQSRDFDHSVICAGIQSVYKRAAEFGDRRMVIIDEAHLVKIQDDGMYRTFLQELAEANPKLRTIGLTATAYRASEGTICRHDSTFQRISYSAPVAKLMQEGYLCKIFNKHVNTEYDTENLHVRGGEFIQREMEDLFLSDQRKMKKACEEIVQKTEGRKSCLIFCAGVNHAYNVAQLLSEFGQEAKAVTGETPALMRSAYLDEFKRGDLPFLVNCDVLTTGFDAPNIDSIAILRATQSPGLFAQMCGRGFRVHPSKDSCLVLDFGENLKRHGPLDSKSYGQHIRFLNGKGPPVSKECPSCHEVVPAGLRLCVCGHVFPPPTAKHDVESDEVSDILQQPVEWIVDERTWHYHVKQKKEDNKPNTVRVDYLCHPPGTTGNLAQKDFSEWLCPEHEGFAKQKFKQWWHRMSRAEVPNTIEECLDMMDKGALADVKSITVKRDGRWNRIVNHQIGRRPGPEDMAEEIDLDPWEAEIPF